MVSPRVGVLIVDQSISACHLMAQHVGATTDLSVLGIAWDSETALDLARRFQPELIVVDPRMRAPNGRPTIAAILRERPARVVLIGAAEEETRSVVRGLGLRAAEFVQKPTQGVPGGHTRMGDDLVAAIRRTALVAPAATLAEGPVQGDQDTASVEISSESLSPVEASANGSRRQQTEEAPRPARRLVVIGTSTGGPAALRVVLPKLTALLDAGLVIIQHMPQTFTRSLAKRLDAECSFPVREAEDGEAISRSLALMAPGDYHLVITGDARVHLHRDPPVHGVRPSLDLTLESAAHAFRENLLAVILTGMGIDGAQGATVVKALGGTVFAEHESTAIVYGMPRSVIEQGSADLVVPLHEMAEVIASWIQARGRSELRPAPAMRTPAIG